MQWVGTFNRKSEKNWDFNLVLYFLNVFLVVYGYGLRGDDFQATKILRTILVVISLGSLLLTRDFYKYKFDSYKNRVLWVFIALNLIVVPFGVDVMRSFERIAAWLPFLIYTNFFVVYLFSNYPKQDALIKLLQIFSLAYFYPVAIMLLNGVSFQSENIYGQNIGAYKANVLGWACVVFLLSSFDVFNNTNTKKWLQYLFYILSAVTLWGIVLTGSRSSYLALAAASTVLVLRSKSISPIFKILILIIICGLAYYIFTSPDSVVNLRAKYAIIRQQRGEIRVQLASRAFTALWEYPGVMFTGFGFDNFRAGLAYYAGIKTDLASHNSYLEVLFSSGLLTFLFFILFFVINSLLKFIKFDSKEFIFLPAILVIPYFESNLNAGQFLFFPWMTFLFYYIHVGSLQVPITNTAEREQYEKAPNYINN